jgi:hypothetical protein
MTRSPSPAGPYMAYPGDDAWPPDMSAWSHGRQATDARFESPRPAEIAVEAGSRGTDGRAAGSPRNAGPLLRGEG